MTLRPAPVTKVGVPYSSPVFGLEWDTQNCSEIGCGPPIGSRNGQIPAFGYPSALSSEEGEPRCRQFFRTSVTH